MAKMTDHVGILAKGVSAINVYISGMVEDMAQIRESMQCMDSNIEEMGGAVKQGGKVFRQWESTKMMR